MELTRGSYNEELPHLLRGEINLRLIVEGPLLKLQLLLPLNSPHIQDIILAIYGNSNRKFDISGRPTPSQIITTPIYLFSLFSHFMKQQYILIHQSIHFLIIQLFSNISRYTFYNISRQFQIGTMRPNSLSNGYVSTPNYFGHRNRLLSINTPKLSPLRMVQSPFPNLCEPNFFQSQLNMGNQFRLQEPQPTEEYVEPVNQSDDESYSQLEFPKFPENQQVTKDNLIDFLVATINIDEDRIQRVKDEFQTSGQTFIAQVFQYLYKRFKKTKKTKEQMIKYTMRKSFKFITDQMKREDPSLVPLLSTDGVQGMSIYFTKHSEDKEISIPFKKNSVQKTMNTAFLKGVFSVEQFAKDYKRFLKTFQNEFLKDNKKKINSMTDAVKACISTKNYKSLQNYKRIPWTTDILAKLKSFAADLLNYSPHKGAISEQNQFKCKDKVDKQAQKITYPNQQEHIKPRKISFQLNTDFYKQELESHRRSGSEDHFKDFINNGEEDEDEHDDLIHQLTNQEKKVKKKSVIILTPPMIPLSDPPRLPQEQPLE